MVVLKNIPPTTIIWPRFVTRLIVHYLPQHFLFRLAYIAWYDALQALSNAGTGVFLYIEPLIAVVVAFFILGEPITVGCIMGGGGVVLFGVWLVNKTQSEKKIPKREQEKA